MEERPDTMAQDRLRRDDNNRAPACDGSEGMEERQHACRCSADRFHAATRPGVWLERMEKRPIGRCHGSKTGCDESQPCARRVWRQ